MRLFLHDYGAYAFTLQLAKNLALQGHSVCYVYSETTQYVKRASGLESVTGLICRGITLSKPYQKYSFVQRYHSEVEHGQRVAKEILDFKPDIVISANTPLDAQYLILQASKKMNARFIFWLQDAISIAIRRTLHQKFNLVGDLISAYYQLLEKYLLRSSDKVILISQDFNGLMDKWDIKREKRHVIPNWAPLEDIPLQAKQNPWSSEHNLADHFCFLYSGILGLKHDPELFIQLAEHFRANELIRIVIISQGGKADELIAKASAMGLANLIVLQFQPNEVYPQVLGTADVLVSILSEDAGSYSVPSKVLSYLCAGKPLLLSIPLENAAARMVLQAKAGLVSPPGDTETFLKNAQELFDERELRLEMGLNAREFAENEFNSANILKQFKTILNL